MGNEGDEGKGTGKRKGKRRGEKGQERGKVQGPLNVMRWGVVDVVASKQIMKPFTSRIEQTKKNPLVSGSEQLWPWMLSQGMKPKHQSITASLSHPRGSGVSGVGLYVEHLKHRLYGVYARKFPRNIGWISGINTTIYSKKYTPF